MQPKRPGAGRNRQELTVKNMSLRDYFAAKAMAAILSSRSHYGEDDIAEWAYAQADEMLKFGRKRA